MTANPTSTIPMRRAVAGIVLVALLAGPWPASASPDGSDLEVFFAKDSLAFRNTRHHQMVDGVRVQDAGASTHVPLAAGIPAVRHEDLAESAERSGGWRITEADAMARALGSVGVVHLTPGTTPEIERVWHRGLDALRAAWEVTMVSDEPAGEWRVTLDGETGRILDTRDLAAHAAGRVFRDNPIVGLKDPSFRDNRLSRDDGSFAGAYMDVDIRNLKAGSLLMESDRVIITDTAIPPGDDFVFPREDVRFLETMAYHWIEYALDRVADAGYPHLVDEPVLVRAHHGPVVVRDVGRVPPVAVYRYPDAYANSWGITLYHRALVPEGPGFGSSAEDAEVIVHELGHRLHWAAAPGLSGEVVQLFNEGTSDFIAAAILSDVSDGYGDACMIEWLTTYYENIEGLDFGYPYGDLRCARVLDNNLTYPEDYNTDGSYYPAAYHNSQMWSGALWDIREAIGTNASLTLVLEAIHLIPSKINHYHPLGRALLLADAGLTGGEHRDVIHAALARHGIDVEYDPLASMARGAAEPEEPVQTPGPGSMIALMTVALAGFAARRRRT